MNDLFLAVETGGTKLQFVLGDAQGCIVQRSRLSVARERGFQGILEAVTAQVPLFSAAAAQNGARIARIGVGFGGPVDARSGCVLGSMQISGWSDFPLQSYLEEKTGLPVRVYNDTDAATWGEYRLGAGRGTRNFFYTNIGSGVGGGAVLNGRLYLAQGRGSMEFGQSYTVGAADTAERVEALCSGWAVEHCLRQAKIPPASVLSAKQQETLTCRDWAEAIRSGDAYACALLDRHAYRFSVGLANVIALLDPEVLAIGGGVALLGEPLLSRLRTQTERLIYGIYRGSYRIETAELQEDAVPLGVLRLLAEETEALQ